MSSPARVFVPFGELKIDGGSFNNDGLVAADNVVPVYGNYIATNFWAQSGDEPSDEAYGLHTHFGGGSTWYAYLGSITKLYEYTSAFAATDKTRSAGGAYATSSAGGENGWQGTSFGDAVVMTNYVDDPQLLTSPAAANFVKLATTAGGSSGTGMDPKAKFVAPVRGNLFLANLNLPSALLRPDGTTELASGAYPTYVAWSQSDNVRAYGSFTATPSLVGTGYQPLAYDYGHINGMIGGEYALISMQRGWVRADGPPYTFRPIVTGQGCRYPNSIVRLDNDVYYWGPSGPAVLRGGEGPPIVLGNDKVARAVIDNATGFSPTYSIYSSMAIRHMSAACDVANGLIYWSYTSQRDTANRIGDVSLIYNTRDDRFSFCDNGPVEVGISGPFYTGIIFLQSAPDLGANWSTGRDLVGVMRFKNQSGTVRWQLASTSYSSTSSLPALTRAYQQLDKDATTRVLRVRPVYSRHEIALGLTVTATISSKNKPYDSATTSTYTTLDTHGWIATPSTVFADFHQVGFSFNGAGGQSITELEGYEVEYAVGGAYSA